MNELNDTNMDAEEFDSEDIEETETAKNPEKTDDSADKKKAEYEASEAKRKAEWEAKQAKKKEEYDKAVAETAAMSDDDIMNASVKKTGADVERLTRRNMKLCVTEHIQTVCYEDVGFARKTMHPQKNMMNCFKYINPDLQNGAKSSLKSRIYAIKISISQ